MTITRANVESELVSRIGAWLSNVGMAITTAGSNASLNSPIGYAIRVVGGTVAAPALVTDDDVATVNDSDLDKFFDVAELRALDSVLSNFVLVDAKAGPVEAKSSQFIDYVRARIAALQQRLALEYGVGGSTVSLVPITYGVPDTDEFSRGYCP